MPHENVCAKVHLSVLKHKHFQKSQNTNSYPYIKQNYEKYKIYGNQLVLIKANV